MADVESITGATGFIDHYYVVDDLRAAPLDVTEYKDRDEALGAYFALSTDKLKAFGVTNTKRMPGSFDFIQCKDGKDTLIEDYIKTDDPSWKIPEIYELAEYLKQRLDERSAVQQVKEDSLIDQVYVDSKDAAREKSDEEPQLRSITFDLTAPEQDGANSDLLGKQVRLDDRDFKIIKVNTYGDVSLEDLTFKSATGYPIVRIEKVDFVRRALEQQEQEQEKTITPAWERQPRAKAQTFDLHPDVPMADRHTFDLKAFELEEVGKKARFRRNVEAIRVLKECEFDNRFATPEEQQVLAQYVGWGGIPEAFDENNAAWEDEFFELSGLLSPEEYASARESTLTAFYTPPVVISAIYKTMAQMGFKEGNILEPSCGIGMMFAVLTLVHTADTKEQLDNDTDELLTTARKHLCQFAVLKYQQMDGLNTALPFGVRKIDSLRTLTTESLSVLMPFRAEEVFHEKGIYYGQNVVSKNMIIANRKQLLNGNAFVLGVSGGGKSFFAKSDITNLRLATNADIIIIDPEREYGALVRALGGEVINLSATSDNHINAMDMSKDYGEDGNPITLKSEFLMSLCEQFVPIGAKEKSIIDRCTANVYRTYLQNNYTGKVPTLKDFREELLRQPEPEAHDIALDIELYIEGSLNTFAKETNVDTDNSLICYDILDLGKHLMSFGMLVVMDSILNRITENRAKGKETYIFIDEIYLLFQHEYSANFLFTLWKRVRKYGAVATGITQNVEDLLQSHTARTMLANSEFIVTSSNITKSAIPIC